MILTFSFFFAYFLETKMIESNFQHRLIQSIKKRFDGCIVLKNDATYIQGIPDLMVLYKNHWAALECKAHKGAHRQPNQEYYVNKMNEMSFAAFIFPENMEEVLDAMEQSFKS